jgi:flagellar basal body-associated protein FliL
MNRRLQIVLLGFMVLLTVAVAGIGAYLFLGGGATARPAANTVANSQSAKQAAAPPTFYTLAHFVTDLSDRDRLRYVDVTVSLAMKDEKSVTDAKKIEPQIRDLILGRLRLLAAADLVGTKGKEQLAATLQGVLGDVLKDSLVKIYVTDLTVQ